MHGKDCIPFISCDCPSVEELILECEASLEQCKNGEGIPPWLTQAEAIEDCEKQLTMLKKTLESRNGLHSNGI